VRRTVLARSHQDIYRLRYAWQQLESRCTGTMFQSFVWNHTAAQAFADREVPFVIYAESDQGAALVPTAIDQARNRLVFLGETLFDYRDVLTSGDPQVLASAWNRASQLGMKFSSGALRSDSNFAAWNAFDVSRFYGAPRVSPKEVTAEEFAQGHKRLASWKRRLDREGVEFKCHTGSNSELVRCIYQQKGTQPSEIGGSLFSDRRRVEFMIEVCRQMGSACEIFTFESAGTLVAALVTFRDRHVRRFYTIYFDQAWAKHSPGMVLLYEVTCRSLKAGLECDYMTGEHSYKTRFATSIVPMYWVEATADALATLGKTEQWQPIAA
jgi:CelD/BcsL family acetyltransferase involved in cellulose biosynthesis